MNRRGRILNRAETAEFFGASLPTVDDWIRRGCPVVKRPRGKGSQWELDSAAVTKWLRETAVRAAVGDVSDVDVHEARRRKIAAGAALAEYDLAERRREVVTVKDVEAVWCRLVANFRSRVLAIPSRLAGRLIGLVEPNVIRDRIETEVLAALDELSDEGRLIEVASTTSLTAVEQDAGLQ